MTETNVQMKQRVEIILEETGYKESRAAKMDLNDILKYVRLPSPHEFAECPLCRLLSAFHDSDIHFAWMCHYLAMPSPLYQPLFIHLAQLSYTRSSCFPYHSADGQETGFSSCSNPRRSVCWTISTTTCLQRVHWHLVGSCQVHHRASPWWMRIGRR